MDTQPARILLVDNDPSTSELLRTDLTRLGHVVEVLGDTETALATLTAASYDLLLIGLDRAGMNTFELLGRVRSDPAVPALPIVMLASPAAEPADIARAIDMGADEFLKAPFHPSIVRMRIAQCLERRSLRAATDDNLQKLQRLSHHLQDVILPLGVSLSTEKNTDLLLERILREAKALCHADGATLYVRTRDDRLKFSIMLTDSLGVALGGTTGKDIPFPPLRLMDPETGTPNYRNIATHVALHGHSVNIPDIYNTTAFDFSGARAFDARNNYRSVSTLTVPLKNNLDQVIAVLQLLNALDPVTGQVTAFDSYQQLVVESLTSQAAVVFNNQLLLQRQEELLKFERDLQIGRQIQAGFLPETLPEPGGWQIAARFQPAREVAGDFYDAFMLGPDTMGFVVADVCDKGVGAALFMALVRSLIRVYTQQRYAALSAEASAGVPGPNAAAIEEAGVTGAALRQAVILANDYIGENHLNMNMFATMFAGAVNIETGEMAYVNGGHNAPILLTVAGSTVRLPSKSPAVGMVPGFQFPLNRAQVNPGDLLVVFSDGIPDARDPHGKFYTEARLLRIVEGAATTPSERLAAEIQESLAAHISTAAQFDDITLMVIRRD